MSVVREVKEGDMSLVEIVLGLRDFLSNYNWASMLDPTPPLLNVELSRLYAIIGDVVVTYP